jgi:hypothetical protein
VLQEVRRCVRAAIENSSEASDADREAYRRGEFNLQIEERTQDIVRDAYRLGDLILKIRRPDGTIEDLSPRTCVWEGESWRQIISGGIIHAPYRIPGSRRRVPHFEPCRVYATRESAHALFAPDAPSETPAPATQPAKPQREKTTPKRRSKPKVDPLIVALKELYPPYGDVPDVPFKSDTQILGAIEKRRPELADTFSPDSVNRARKMTREAALAVPKK